jgi:enoyl-[acyl-carrier protein] reductase III
MIQFRETAYWALILGGSSGMGWAAAKALAAAGMNLALVHRDRRADLKDWDSRLQQLRAHGASVLSWNLNVLLPERREQVLTELASELADRGGKVRLLLHALSRGNLKPLLPEQAGQAALSEADLLHTVEAMGTNLLSWVQGLQAAGLFAADARILGLTSEGNQRTWPGYAAVAAAKATLEALTRHLAVELAPLGLRANLLQPGITDTPSLRQIPGHEALMAHARERNPFGRLTTPEDVAKVILWLCTDDSAWINGALIPVDGGERLR